MSKQFQIISKEEILKIVYDPIKNLVRISRPTFKVGQTILFETYQGSQLPKGIWLTRILSIDETILGKQYRLHVVDNFGPMSKVPKDCTIRFPVYVDNEYHPCLMSDK